MIKAYHKYDLDNDFIEKHFTIKELECKCSECNITFLDTELVQKLHILREIYNKKIYVTSCYRCQAHNKAVGGVFYSYHCQGRAVDLVLPKQPENRKQLIKLCRQIFDYVQVYGTKNFVHCHVIGE